VPAWADLPIEAIGVWFAAGYTVVFLTNAGFLVVGGWLGLRSHPGRPDAE